MARVLSGPDEELQDPARSDGFFVFAERLGISTYLRDPQCNFFEPFFFRTTVGAVPAAAR